MTERGSEDCMSMISELPPQSDVMDIVPSRTREHDAKNVRFSDVLVRRYDLICTGLVNHGPGIGLGWSSTDDFPVSIEVYEQTRKTRQPSNKLVLSALQRKRLLMENHGYRINDLHRLYNHRVVSGPPKKQPTSSQRLQKTTSISPALQQLAPAFGKGDMLRTATKMFARVGF